MIGFMKLTATLAGTAWVTVHEFETPAYVWEVWMKVPTALGTGDGVLVALFNGSYLTDGDERYNSGNKAEGDDYDLTIKKCVTSGDKIMIKADGATTKDVEFIIYYED